MQKAAKVSGEAAIDTVEPRAKPDEAISAGSAHAATTRAAAAILPRSTSLARVYSGGK